MRTPRYQLDVRAPTANAAGPIARNRASPQSVFAPFRSHARGYVPRRDGRHSLSVLPETGRRPTYSRSRSQAATADDLSSARRREESRHAGGIPKGKALWSLLPTSGEAEVGPRREQKEFYKLQSIHLPEERLPASPPPFQYTIFRIQSKLFPSRRRPGRALAIPP